MRWQVRRDGGAPFKRRSKEPSDGPATSRAGADDGTAEQPLRIHNADASSPCPGAARPIHSGQGEHCHEANAQ
jgi:hypothetical protein